MSIYNSPLQHHGGNPGGMRRSGTGTRERSKLLRQGRSDNINSRSRNFRLDLIQPVKSSAGIDVNTVIRYVIGGNRHQRIGIRRTQYGRIRIRTYKEGAGRNKMLHRKPYMEARGRFHNIIDTKPPDSRRGIRKAQQYHLISRRCLNHLIINTNPGFLKNKGSILILIHSCRYSRYILTARC